MTRIIGDTTSGLTLQEAKSLGIEYIPQFIVFQEKIFRDDTEMDSAAFVKMLESSPVLPKTAAPPPALYTPIYEDMKAKGENGIVLCPSGALSGTIRGATAAKDDFPDLDVRVIDTQNVGGGLATMLIEAQKMAQAGSHIDDIEAMIRDMISRQRVFGYVDTLEYLYKGGRIGGAAKFIGDMIQIKPILTVKDGKVESFEKQRTKKKALARMIEIVENDCAKNPEKSMFSFSMLDTNPELEFLQKAFNEKFGTARVPFYNVPPGIMVHAGPSVILTSYFVY